MASNKNIRFLAATKLGITRKKYCRFKKSGIKYIDYNERKHRGEIGRDRKEKKAEAQA